MSDFIVEKLTKSVGDKSVFKEISFIIHDLDRIGIIGVNGTGKTTLLDVVSERIGFDGDVSWQQDGRDARQRSPSWRALPSRRHPRPHRNRRRSQQSSWA